MWLLIIIYMKKVWYAQVEETQAYHAIREKLRHPGCALDLKAKDLIGHLWVSLIIDQSERLVCYLFLHLSTVFNFNFLPYFCLSALKKFQIFVLFGINITALLSADQHREVFSCIFLGSKSINKALLLLSYVFGGLGTSFSP